jgi:hypothetical protein
LEEYMLEMGIYEDEDWQGGEYELKIMIRIKYSLHYDVSETEWMQVEPPPPHIISLRPKNVIYRLSSHK